MRGRFELRDSTRDEGLVELWDRSEGCRLSTYDDRDDANQALAALRWGPETAQALADGRLRPDQI
jgi:hypothetical protein